MLLQQQLALNDDDDVGYGSVNSDEDGIKPVAAAVEHPVSTGIKKPIRGLSKSELKEMFEIYTYIQSGKRNLDLLMVSLPLVSTSFWYYEPLTQTVEKSYDLNYPNVTLMIRIFSLPTVIQVLL
jgi:hypothetical protein